MFLAHAKSNKQESFCLAIGLQHGHSTTSHDVVPSSPRDVEYSVEVSTSGQWVGKRVGKMTQEVFMGQYRTWYDSHCFLELIHMMSSNTKEDWESWDI